MPAKPSGEVKTRIIRSLQPNGDIYVLERKIKYDPEKKWNHVLSTKLMEKIPKGTETPVPTRPKRPPGKQAKESPGAISAVREHIGMMEIIGHIGAVSGIDNGIYGSTDLGTAQKIISLARYLLATNGQSLPGILTWQLNHPLPYVDGLSKDVYHDLFARIGRDESLRQNFQQSRGRAEDDQGADALLDRNQTAGSFHEAARQSSGCYHNRERARAASRAWYGAC